MDPAMKKAIDGAFTYHPFGQLAQVGDWTVGPVFAVKQSYDEDAPTSIFRAPDGLPNILTSMLKATPPDVVRVAAVGHPRESFYQKDKWGSNVEHKRVKCTCRAVFEGETAVGELAFPMVRLAKKLGVDNWRRDGRALYGYRETELVAIFAMKDLDNCLTNET